MVGFLLVALLGGLALAASGTAKKPKAIEERRMGVSKEAPKTVSLNAEPASAAVSAPLKPLTPAPANEASPRAKETSIKAAFALEKLPGFENRETAPAGDPAKLIEDVGKSMKEVLANPLAKGPRNEITGKFTP